jgi:fatty-acyl-CoA synthase
MNEKDKLQQNLMRRQAVGDYLKRAAAKLPDKTALIFRDKRFSYGEFNAVVNRAAHALSELGIKKGDVVAVISQNCHQMAILMWSCFKIGAWYSPLNYLLRGSEITYQVNHSGAKIFFVESALLDAVKEVENELKTVKHFGLINLKGIDLPKGWIDVEGLFSDKYPNTEPEVIINDSDVASLIYTSGTTAAPKGAMISNGSYFSQSCNFLYPRNAWFDEEDVYLMNIPLYHIGASSIFVAFVKAGATSIATYGSDPVEMLDVVQKEKVTYFIWPPTLYAGMLRMPLEKYDLSSLKKLVWFGGSMPMDAFRRWHEICPQATLMSHCSQTEINITFTFGRYPEEPEAGNVIGKPAPDVELRLVDENDKDVPEGQPGEAIVRTPSVMLGYYKNEEATAKVFRGGWLHTGDVLRRGKDGNYYYIDRQRDMVKSGGTNIACLEVEEILNSHPDIEVSAVFGVFHPYWVEGLTAAIVPKSESLTEEDVMEYAKEKLAAYKLPKKIILLKRDELPVSPTGKILKRELRVSYKDIYKGVNGK